MGDIGTRIVLSVENGDLDLTGAEATIEITRPGGIDIYAATVNAEAKPWNTPAGPGGIVYGPPLAHTAFGGCADMARQRRRNHPPVATEDKFLVIT